VGCQLYLSAPESLWGALLNFNIPTNFTSEASWTSLMLTTLSRCAEGEQH
jgi:hypothetical protein